MVAQWPHLTNTMDASGQMAFNMQEDCALITFFDFGAISVAYLLKRYGDSVDNTVEQNSSVFSLIRMRRLPSARACGQ